MSKRIIYLSLLLLSIGVTFSSCEKRKNRDVDIKRLSDLELRVDSTFNRIEDLEIEKIQATISLIKKDLKTIEKNFTGTMELDHALKLDRYKDITKLYKRFSMGTITVEMTKTKIQLTELKKVMSMNATVDKNGNVIDDTYIDNAIVSEQKYTEEILGSVKGMEDRKEEFYSRFNDLKPFVDSLKSTMTTPD